MVQGSFEKELKKEKLCATTVYGYIRLHEFISQYPRVLVSTSCPTVWLNNLKKMAAHMEENTDLAERMAVPLKTMAETL